MNGPIVAVTDDVTLVVFHGRPEAQPKKKKEEDKRKGMRKGERNTRSSPDSVM